MGGMFSGCSSLASLDLSSFDTSAVTGMGSMFSGCSSLSSVKVGASFSFTPVSGRNGCTLPGIWWRSSAEGRDYTSSQIATTRDNVADTYSRISVPVIMDAVGDVVWSPGIEEPVVFRSSAPISEFVEVRMDGEIVDPVNYDVREGSTIVEFKPEYLATLSKGNHTIGIVSSYGVAEAPMKIEEAGYVPERVQIDSVALDVTKYIYDGAEKKPAVTVTAGGKMLVEDTDYTVSYPSDVINAGTKTVVVIGKGKYAGTKTASYEILAPEPVDPKPGDPEPANPEPVEPGTTDPEPENPGTIDPAPDDPGATDPGVDPGADPEPSDPGATDPEPVGTQAMYRLYNPNSGEHFYTASTVERDAVITAGWNDEGIGWTAPTSGIRVYRLYNSFAGEHHYTTSETERDMLVSVGWTWEEGGWFSDEAESVPLYFANNHHYTTDWGEFQTLLSLGWQDEGVGWHGVN